MSPKKKNRSRERPKGVPSPSTPLGINSVEGKKITNQTPKAKILPFTAGKLPSVSRSMPQAASAIPLVSKEIPSISKSLPQVSAKPNIAIPKYWGKMPSKKWGVSKIQATRKRGPKRPKDIGLFKFLGKVVTAPYQPVEMVKGITAAVGAQAEEEKDPKVALEQKLLELKMRREMNKISEGDYKIEETKLKRRIKNLEEKEKTKEKAIDESEGKRKKRRKKNRR